MYVRARGNPSPLFIDTLGRDRPKWQTPLFEGAYIQRRGWELHDKKKRPAGALFRRGTGTKGYRLDNHEDP